MAEKEEEWRLRISTASTRDNTKFQTLAEKIGHKIV